MAHDPQSFSWWKSALSDPAKIGSPDLLIHDSSPHQGYYRTRLSKGARFSPIVYWFEGDALYCQINGKPVGENEALAQWTWAARNPVSYNDYLAAVDGKPWADEIQVEQANGEVRSSQEKPKRTAKAKADPKQDEPAENPRAVIGNNSGSLADEIRDEIAEWERELAKLVKAGPIMVLSEADKLADIKEKLSSLQKRADDQRKEEKQPFLDEGRRIDALWNPIIDQAKDGKSRAADHLTVFQKKQREEARQRAAEEARRLAGAAADSGEAAPEPAEDIKVSAGTGRRASLVKQKITVIDDFKKVGGYFLDQEPVNPELKDTLSKLTRRLHSAGVSVPGARVEIEERSR